MADFYISASGEYYYILGDGNLISSSGEFIIGVTTTPAGTPEAGNPIGLLMALTYSE